MQSAGSHHVLAMKMISSQMDQKRIQKMLDQTQQLQISQLRDTVRKQISKSREMRACYRALCLLMTMQGYSVNDIAEALGESSRTIERWRKRFNEHGLDGLLDSTSPGRPSRLSEQEMADLQKDIRLAPTKHGFKATHWHGKELQEHLQIHYQVELSLRQCQRLLKKIA